VFNDTTPHWDCLQSNGFYEFRAINSEDNPVRFIDAFMEK
jgi:hypothetical protein